MNVTSNNGKKDDGDFTRIDWNPAAEGVFTKNSTLALKTAIAVARAFDANCALRNPQRECTVPMFEPQELVLGELLRSGGFFTCIHLRGIRLTKDLKHGAFSEEEEEYRERFAERSIDGHYAVKFLHSGVYNSVHAASAAADFMMETKLLMNLSPHPNICQILGVTAAGSDAFLSKGNEGFYIIVDRMTENLVQRLDQWRDQRQENREKMAANGEDGMAIAKAEYEKIMERLEMALDIASALLFLSDRQIVFNLRPEKVGFDFRYETVKLCDFGQARENGQIDQAPSLIKTDDIRTLAYTAPEVLCQAPVTVSADVYAFGFVLHEILSLERPFDGMSRSEHFERVVMAGERPKIPVSFPKVVKQLVEHCWNSHLRPTMKRVYDTVEEILLFQDDKPDLVPVTVMLPYAVGRRKADDEATKSRRSSVKGTPSASDGDGKGKKIPRRVKSSDDAVISRQATAKTSNQRRAGHKSHQATSKDNDRAPPSPRRSGEAESSKTKERVSRRARTKNTTSGDSHSTIASKNNSSSNLLHEDESERSLHDILQEEGEDEKEGHTTQKKMNYKANQSMPVIPAVREDDDDGDGRRMHSSFSGTDQKMQHRKRRTKKEHHS